MSAAAKVGNRYALKPTEQEALEAIRVGDPFNAVVALKLVRRGFACWIGGSIFITSDGREALRRAEAAGV